MPWFWHGLDKQGSHLAWTVRVGGPKAKGGLVQWGSRGTGLGRTPHPYPGILACRDA